MSTRDKVLNLFEKNRGFFVSGERIAEKLNISRTAVWKAVKKLQDEGYDIKAITNRGYCLSKDSDVLSVHGILTSLDEYTREFIRPEVFVRVDSTNTVCMQKASAGEAEGYAAVAGSQNAGRGRRGRAFFSPAGSGIYMSILLRPEGYTQQQIMGLTSMAAVAVSEAIEVVSEKQTGIKWVNDIMIDGKKVCGILAEASFTAAGPDSVVIGIGINAYTPEEGFPEAISGIAGSVFDEMTPGLKNRLAASVLSHFTAYYKGTSPADYKEEYKRRSLVTGKEITVLKKKSSAKATALGLDDDLGLMVRYEDGSEETLRSGEISIRL